MTEHRGRVALVTGGSQGIGLACAMELSRQGAAVVVHGLESASTDAAVAQITAAGGQALGTVGDIADPAVAERAVQTAVQGFGRLDTLVTSAGIQRYGDAVQTTPEEWGRVMAVNVGGTFLACHFALPELRKCGDGSIVIIASVQATATQTRVAAYTASKGALVALARAIAVDEAEHGVRVNSVSPGSVDTPMLRAAAADFGSNTPEAVEELIATWGSAHPLGRVARPDEIGAVVSFLASTRSSFITGEDIRVDGGVLAQLPVTLPERRSDTDGHSQ